MRLKVLFGALLLFLSTLLFSQTITDSLVVFYPFDGNANDASVNALDATVYGASLTMDRFGAPNGAYLFDGVNDYIELPNDSKLKPQFPFSVSMWVTFNGINPVNTVVIYKNDDASSGYHGFWIGVNPTGSIAAAYGDGLSFSTTSRRTKHSDTLINFNDWFHIVAVFNGPNDIDLFVNCSEDQGSMSGGATNSTIPYTSVNPKIGWSQHATPIYFQGKMDEIAFWNRSLTYMEARRLCDNMPISVGVNQDSIFSELRLKIFPNPGSGNFHVELNKSALGKNVDFEIYNSVGKLIFSKSFRQNTVIQSNLQAGVYYVRARIDNKCLRVKKLIIN